jgi:hypothetical protein
MKKYLLIFILSFLGKNSFAQDTTIIIGFVPGYYIINSNAQYAVVMYSSADFYMDETGLVATDDSISIIMKAGEVVVAFELSNDKYYCFDPNGRMLVFQGNKCLTRAPLKKGSGVGKLLETIELIDGGSLMAGAYYWIVGQDITKSTITIQVENGTTMEIPQSKIQLYSNQIKGFIKQATFTKVAE